MPTSVLNWTYSLKYGTLHTKCTVQTLRHRKNTAELSGKAGYGGLFFLKHPVSDFFFSSNKLLIVLNIHSYNHTLTSSHTALSNHEVSFLSKNSDAHADDDKVKNIKPIFLYFPITCFLVVGLQLNIIV